VEKFGLQSVRVEPLDTRGAGARRPPRTAVSTRCWSSFRTESQLEARPEPTLWRTAGSADRVIPGAGRRGQVLQRRRADARVGGPL